MPRERKGSSFAKTVKRGDKTFKVWYAQIQYYDDAGNRIQRRQKAENKSEARRLARDMLAEVESGGSGSLDAARMTFADLADYYQRTYLIDPEYRDGRKIAGLRSKYDFEHRLKALKDFFGKKKLRAITHGELSRYKTHRLKTPVVVGRNTRGTDKEGNPQTRPRSIATVHRELSFLRRILNVALSSEWILRNPFEQGEPLIKPGDEKPREKIISPEEEDRLLAACDGERSHLKAIIICALDTGMRRGEVFKLKWSDIDFENGLVTIQAFNTKTMRQRQVAMTERLIEELRPLSEYLTRQQLVFGIRTSVKTAFNKAKIAAGLPDLRFHDLRHTHATRLVTAQMPLSEVGRVLGHTQPSTTYRYINANVDTARRAADLLNEFNKRQSTEIVH